MARLDESNLPTSKKEPTLTWADVFETKSDSCLPTGNLQLPASPLSCRCCAYVYGVVKPSMFLRYCIFLHTYMFFLYLEI